MHVELVIPRLSLDAALVGLAAAPARPQFLAAAPVQLAPDSLRLLCARATGSEPERLAVVLNEPSIEPLSHNVLRLSAGEDGGFQASVRIGSKSTSVESLFLPGPGMYRLGSDGTALKMIATTQRWSRVAGALGQSVWQRFCALRVAIIGAGRNGSLAADGLARSGMRQLVLVDPDRVGSHNLDMTGVSPHELHLFKVRAIREAVERTCPEIGVVSVSEGVLSLNALSHLKSADILLSTVDDDQARSAVAFLATVLGLVHLDIATGILNTETRAMGADIRLLLPGDGCLLCRGGLASREHARRILTNTRSLPAPWYEQRAGSLPSLNGIAVGLGLRLLEDLVAERVRESRWLHLEFSPDGQPELRDITTRSDACGLCQHHARGDSAIGDAYRILGTALGTGGQTINCVGREKIL